MSTLEDLLTSGNRLAAALASLYPGASADRFARLLERLGGELDVDPRQEVRLASAPGRTELAGNHTDHNHGRVLAASVSMDTIAALTPRSDGTIRVSSDGFPLVEVSVDELDAVESERESTAALVRGVAAGFAREGYRIGGFDAVVGSTVLPGSGLSSSASFEVLVGAILDAVYNGGEVGPTRIAQIGKFAENQYFGKPSGLMDQVACATGGAVAIDFRDPAEPLIEQIDVSFEDANLALLVVDTGANHADLTDEHAAIPSDMRTVASRLGGEVLRDVDLDALSRRLPELRAAAGDRAVSRAIHFYDENTRVGLMVESLRRGDFGDYLRLMADSGRSSGLYLQNCVPVSHPERQGVVVALALTEHFFLDSGLKNGVDAACRVHGGGFAGTIQVLLPSEAADRYSRFITEHLGDDAVARLTIRNTGAVCCAP